MRTAAASSACTSSSASARPSPSEAMKSCACSGAETSGNDIDVLAAAHDRKRFELEPPVRRAFAGRDVVFVAVPRTDEMRLGRGEALAMPSAVGAEHVLDLVHDDALARGTALVNAQVLVGVVAALPVEHADLHPVVGDDAPVAVGELGGLGDEHVRHGSSVVCGVTANLAQKPRKHHPDLCAAGMAARSQKHPKSDL